MPSSVPEGWYPDPTGRTAQRWWDGQEWTEHAADADGRTTTDPFVNNGGDATFTRRRSTGPWLVAAPIAGLVMVGAVVAAALALGSGGQALTAGTCVRIPIEAWFGGTLLEEDLVATSCDEWPDLEVFARMPAGAGNCIDAFASYVGISYMESVLYIEEVRSMTDSDPVETICLLGDPDGPLSGSQRGSRR